MDAFFYRTNYFCSFYGVVTNVSNKHKAVNYWRKFIVTLNVITSLFIYFRVGDAVLNETYSLMDLFRTALSILSLKTLYDIKNNFHWLNLCMSIMLKSLPKKYIAQMRKLDFVICFFLILTNFIACFSVFYTFASGQFEGMRALIVGPADTRSSDLVIFILSVQYDISIGYIAASSVLYIEIQVLMGYYCRSLNDSLLAKDVIFLDELIRNCRCINRIRHLLNKSFGFIPFALMVIHWLFFVVTLSFTQTYDSIRYNGMTVAAVIFLVIGAIILLEVLVRATCFFDLKAHKFRESCALLTNRPQMHGKTLQFRMVSILNDFLLNEKLPPMMAYGTIKIRPNLGLSIIDSMVSFTALISTSFRVHIK